MEILDGGCILYRLPLRVEPERRKVRRAMTQEERELAIQFGLLSMRENSPIAGNRLAMAMVTYALRRRPITEKQSRGIYAIARCYGIIGEPQSATS
jgi:hypothetical protein